jgi:hypothetical protein
LIGTVRKRDSAFEGSMLILHGILGKPKDQFAGLQKDRDRGIWFIYTIHAIIIPFTVSKTSKILRSLINTLSTLIPPVVVTPS